MNQKSLEDSHLFLGREQEDVHLSKKLREKGRERGTDRDGSWQPQEGGSTMSQCDIET